jgi:hypothetical protein
LPYREGYMTQLVTNDEKYQALWHLEFYVQNTNGTSFISTLHMAVNSNIQTQSQENKKEKKMTLRTNRQRAYVHNTDSSI